MDIDSNATLALMAKAQKVFASDDSFLAFPVTPLVYDRSELDFSMSGSADEVQASYRNIEAFSLLVNLIPEGNAWIPSESRFLWDEYAHVLRQGSCASSTRTPEEEAKYLAARDYLKDTDADGLERDSPQLLKFKQYQDAIFSVQQEFAEASASDVGEFSDDEAVRKHWTDVVEPAFRERLTALEREWVLEGYKNEVEKAQNEQIVLGAKSPLATWLDWKSNFDPQLDSQTGAATQIEVFPTSFAPDNALDDSNWNRFDLDGTTIDALVAQAPAELKKRFGASAGKSNIESMSLEFSSAVLNRHWFNKDVLHSRFWRLTDGSKVLSDGGVPANGDCPAYVTGIVFARHVAVKKKTNTPSSGQAPPIPNVQWNLQFSQLAVGKPVAMRLDPALLQTIQPVRVQPKPRSGARAARRPVAAIAARPTVAGRPLTGTRPQAVAVSARPMVAAAPVRPMSMPMLPLKPNAVALQQLVKQGTFKRLDISKITFPPGTGIRPPPPPPPPESDADEIRVLAFICTGVPKCPDPDPSLVW